MTGFVDNSQTTTPHDEARRMLDVFTSVGATGFHLTWTNRANQPRRSHRGIGAATLRLTIANLLDDAIAETLNLIIRPYGRTVRFIQLDDLNADRLPTVAPAMFLSLETSPGPDGTGSFQAWLALPGRHDREFARRVRRAAGADLAATGATRIAGSLNFKDKYAPDFPRVRIRDAQPGRRVTAAELTLLGLVAPPEQFTPLAPMSAPIDGSAKWPSYTKCLAGAPLNRDGSGPDRSRADYWWCFLAIAWGQTVAATADRLLEQSSKARDLGASYALHTTQQAALAVERRRKTPASK